MYSPDALQTLELKEGAEWKQESSGVSVTGAVCVKGGVDGDNSKAALYVVGGATNDSFSSYPGLQRYSISDKSWTTIVPVTNVTQNRQHHGAAYMNSSSSLLVYGGSQDNSNGPSSQTFLIDLFPPYRVLAYSSIASPGINPIMLSWGEDRTLMVGGGSSNIKTFTFGPSDGWQDLGLSLPDPLPDRSKAQCALLTLGDESRILQTFDLGQTPPTVTTNVLLNPGGQPATFGETAGGPSRAKRVPSLNDYPTYNGTLAPSATRTGFSLAQGDDGLVAFVGGSNDDPIVFFNQSENGWIRTTQLLGRQQEPLISPSSSMANPSSTAAEPSSTAAGASTGSGSSSRSRALTILGGVLGGVLGVAAILIILLLCLRRTRKKRAAAEKNNEYVDDKGRNGEYNSEERGLRPLAKAGQPMGRSPVPSAVMSEADSTAMLGKPDSKHLIRRVSSDRAQPGFRGSGIGFGQAMFKREKEKGQLSISKPMMPVLGDYKERPTIDLGKATPPAPVASKAAGKRQASQRKTNEGWGKYFQSEPTQENRSTFISKSSYTMSRTNSGFWPGSGVPENSTRSPKYMLRDSIGNPLEAQSVAAGSPTVEHFPANSQSRDLQSVQGMSGRISNASSIETTNSEDDEDFDDDDYEDEQVERGVSSGVPSNVRDVAWTPVGNTWSGPAQRPLRPPSGYVTAQARAQPTMTPDEESDTSGGSIPAFPMPNSIRSLQPSIGSGMTVHAGGRNERSRAHEDAGDYFSQGRAASGARDQGNGLNNENDMSWLNLGTPTR